MLRLFMVSQEKSTPSTTTVVPDRQNSKGKETMYAVAFDLDTELLRQTYGDPANNAYGEIKKFLVAKGFTWQQGSVYFGTDRINAVTCVMAITEMSRALPWFATSVRDIRMLRIEEYNDLMPALQLGS